MKILSTLLIGVLAVTVSAQPKPKALLIMLDGVRSDGMLNAATPNLDRLAAGQWQSGYRGAYSDCASAVPDAAPNSAPNHVAIMTGVTANKHKVFKNGTTKAGNYQEFPTILARLKTANPALGTLFAYSWGEDGDIAPGQGEIRMRGADTANAAKLAEILRKDDAPDAIVWYVDAPDHAGHRRNFYPHSAAYIHSIQQCDRMIGELLAVIRSRPNFAGEDWLIAVNADHGGYRNMHGVGGGHCSALPIVLASRHLAATGMLPGRPGNVDVPVTVLNHFGVNTDSLSLDGRKLGGGIVEPAVKKLSDDLVQYLPLDAPSAAVVPAGTKPPVYEADGCFGGHLSFAAAKGETASFKLGEVKLVPPFTLSMWVQLPGAQSGDAAIVSNKDWKNGTNPGLIITPARRGEKAKSPGIFLNYGLAGGKRVDLGQYDVVPGEWVFLALSVEADGVVRFVQGGADGRFYLLSEVSPQAVFDSGLPLMFGQDGTGNYEHNFTGRLDDVAIWKRALDTAELQRIYHAGRQGISLGELRK